MGTVPVAPRKNRLSLEGESMVRGLIPREVPPGLINTDSKNMATLTPITVLTNRAGSLNSRRTQPCFQDEPGFRIPQCGHVRSLMLISL
jgi:hypothetical protein